MRIAWIGTYLGLLSAATASGAEKTDCLQVLEPAPKVQPPAPLEAVRWRGDLGNAFEQARREGRPLFVTMRCLPCKQCSAFDKGVLGGGPELDPLLKQFVTVRLTDAQDVDLRVLPMADFQDL